MTVQTSEDIWKAALSDPILFTFMNRVALYLRNDDAIVNLNKSGERHRVRGIIINVIEKENGEISKIDNPNEEYPEAWLSAVVGSSFPSRNPLKFLPIDGIERLCLSRVSRGYEIIRANSSDQLSESQIYKTSRMIYRDYQCTIYVDRERFVNQILNERKLRLIKSARSSFP